MVMVNDSIRIPDNEITFSFIQSSGPGGQNVNKVATAAQLHFNILLSSAMDEHVKSRLIKLAGKRVSSEGVLIIEAKRYRSQEKNRLDAINRLVMLVTQAFIEPRPRKKTRPSLTASAARVNHKRERGKQKKIRRYNADDWE
ncbi:MAG: aminoacyl-tRNA hydrolase [Anaerolinea sp.]|nr:aminoacyl-tRNA hydrolase [Anaerolinea sp.]